MGRKGIIHRDLKPENILIDTLPTRGRSYDVRIADFGYSIFEESIKTNEKNMICGTPGFVAPEVFLGKGYTHKSDVFSVGSILYSMLTLRNLFTGRDDREMMLANKECNLEFLETRLHKHSKNLIDFLKLILSKDPKTRPTARQALKHPWFKREQSPLKESLNINRILANSNSSANPEFS